MYRAIQIARYIIDLCNREGNPVSNLELQKILYFLQVYYMRRHDGLPLFEDEICAWPYGPVVPDVYYTYNGYGGAVIRNSYDTSDVSNADREALQEPILRLKQKGPWTLVDMSHKADGPWDVTYKDGMGNRKVINPGLLLTDTNKI